MGINKLHALLLALFFAFSSLETPTFAKKKSYVVYLGDHSHGPEPTSHDFDRAENSHHEFLGSFMGCKEKAKKAMVYSHKKKINAFSAMLDPKEAEKISKHKDVISVFEGKRPQLHTTNSWEFLGMENHGELPTNSVWKKWEFLGIEKHGDNPSETMWEKSEFGEDIIIANLDTGVYPESPMFRDEGMGRIPEKWKGRCKNIEDIDDDGVVCNKKLLSMRSFYKSMLQTWGEELRDANVTFHPKDESGHGTHTLSTAGGRFTTVNSFGYKNGTAKGGSPNARVASYKVMFDNMPNEVCSDDADIVEAHDEAIHDGVDVLSVSAGSGDNGDDNQYFQNGFAIGSFHATREGVVVVASAGNLGPREGLLDNVWPWVITVGASTIDRKFSASVYLGDNQQLKGVSLSNCTLPEKKSYPLVYFLDVTDQTNHTNMKSLEQCGEAASLYREKVEGNIVIFDLHTDYDNMCEILVRDAGGVGMIVFDDLNESNELRAKTSFLPTAYVSRATGHAILNYMSSTPNPVAYISPPTVELNAKPAPMVASLSSRGPNTLTPEILKPDIIAPGVDILAAFPVFPDTKEQFAVMSGTSMATPHVAGVVALLKAIHPDWSPAMIKSAIMTTASLMDNTDEPIKDFDGQPATPFSMGAGHIQPNSAVDPGLVYDLTNDDYIKFLCAFDLKKIDIAAAYNVAYNCSESYDILSFNYPSITVPKLSNTTIVTRTLTNVGTPGTYEAKVVEPFGVSVIVEPKMLVFGKEGEEQSYRLIFKAKQVGEPKEYVYGRIEWTDGVHNVMSPIVVNSA
ncbi:hypothetical protein ACHQM5_011139 [Ranunculus cassubicifolius]